MKYINFKNCPVFVGLCASMMGPVYADTLKMLTAWGGNHSGTANMAYGYNDLVEELSSGAITIKPFGPESSGCW